MDDLIYPYPRPYIPYISSEAAPFARLRHGLMNHPFVEGIEVSTGVMEDSLRLRLRLTTGSTLLHAVSHSFVLNTMLDQDGFEDKLMRDITHTIDQHVKEIETGSKLAAEDYAKRPVDCDKHLVGWRKWKVVDDKLHPIGMGVGAWGGANAHQAKCERFGHSAPNPYCQCGLYTYHPGSTSEASGSASIVTAPHGGDLTMVTGLCRVWGRVEVYAEGLRSEWAQPVLLFYPNNAPETTGKIKALGARLGLDAEPVSSMQEQIPKYGIACPVELRPKPATYLTGVE